MFENAKVGDRVWDFVRNEWGEIIKIDKMSGYPLTVKFKRDGYRYTVDGKVCIDDVNPRLFWQEIKFEIPEKPFDLKKFLLERSLPVGFDSSSDNYCIVYSVLCMSFEVHTEQYIEHATVYFDCDNIYYVVETLNDKNITMKELAQAYKELGWL